MKNVAVSKIPCHFRNLMPFVKIGPIGRPRLAGRNGQQNWKFAAFKKVYGFKKACRFPKKLAAFASKKSPSGLAAAVEFVRLSRCWLLQNCNFAKVRPFLEKAMRASLNQRAIAPGTRRTGRILDENLRWFAYLLAPGSAQLRHSL